MLDRNYKTQSGLAVIIEIYIEQWRHLASEHETTKKANALPKFTQKSVQPIWLYYEISCMYHRLLIYDVK